VIFPTLETERLTLRRLELTDAARVRDLAGQPDIAATTINTPHPYPEGAAETFITQTHEAAENGLDYTFAIVPKGEVGLVGCIGLHLAPPHQRAEMGYWMGRPYWRHGYTTEAARRVVRFGFEDLHLNRIMASCFRGNFASARVMQKAGMTYEGTLQQHFLRFGQFHDAEYYAVLREEWQSS
jgi:[ribosomal protein S5]-alanine N-acetyltransferase